MPRPSIRPRLLQAGMEHIHRHGYHASGVAALTSAASAPKGSFYNHFASKESFAVAVVDGWVRDDMLADLRDPSRDPVERVREHFGDLRSRQIAARFQHGCLLGNFAAEAAADTPAIRHALVDAFDRWEAALAEPLRQAPGHDSASAIETARFLIEAWEGAVLRSKVSHDPSPLDRFMRHALAPAIGDCA